jgi:Reverse transcriptase (RNA-dependent DNA polymerase)
MTLIHKTDDKQLLNNYRAISVLSVFNKILERLIHKRLTTFLEKHSIIYGFQYGFRSQCFTTVAGMEVVNEILLASDEKFLVAGCYLD